MKIGELDLGEKLILAPMADITDKSFRRIAKDFGAGLTFTQMVSAEGVVLNNFETLRLFSFSRQEKPIGVQILGNDPEIIFEAVKEIEKFNPDVIDFNSGCSVSKVTKHDFGASLLDEPSLLSKIILKMKLASTKTPISVKLRLGRNNSNISILENAKLAEASGADYIVIHCRTRADKYETPANWTWIDKIKSVVSIPVVANGSIFSVDDIINVKSKYSPDSFMIARGAIGNPFIFSRFNSIINNNFDPGEPTLDEIFQTVVQHANYLIEDYGEDIAIQKIKKHAIWYFRNKPGIFELIEKIFSFENFNSFFEFLEEHASRIKNNFYKNCEGVSIQKLFNERINFWELSIENKF